LDRKATETLGEAREGMRKEKFWGTQCRLERKKGGKRGGVREEGGKLGNNC